MSVATLVKAYSYSYTPGNPGQPYIAPSESCPPGGTINGPPGGSPGGTGGSCGFVPIYGTPPPGTGGDAGGATATGVIIGYQFVCFPPSP